MSSALQRSSAKGPLSSNTDEAPKSHSRQGSEGLAAVPDSIASAGGTSKKRPSPTSLEGGGVKAAKASHVFSLSKDNEATVLEIYKIMAVAERRTDLIPQYVTITRLSEKIKDVHPFSFLLFVKENETLKGYLKTLKTNWATPVDEGASWLQKAWNVVDTVLRNPWKETVEDISTKIKNHKDENTLRLEEFQGHIDPEHHVKINSFLERNLFTELVDHFFEHHL